MTDDAEPTMLTDRVIQIVENAPGIKSADIYALIPEVKSSSIAACLCHLLKQGRLDRTGTPRNFSYYPGGDGPAGASTTDGPAAQATEAGPVRTIVAPEMRRQAAAPKKAVDKTRDEPVDTARAARGLTMEEIEALRPAGGVKTEIESGQPKEFSMTSDGRLVIPFPLKTVTLDAETTRALGQFLMFTMPVWRGEAA